MVNFKLRISSNFTDFTIIFCFSILASYAGHSSGTQQCRETLIGKWLFF